MTPKALRPRSNHRTCHVAIPSTVTPKALRPREARLTPVAHVNVRRVRALILGVRQNAAIQLDELVPSSSAVFKCTEGRACGMST